MCNIDCSTKWITKDLTACNAKCGSGQKRQQVTCVKVEGNQQITLADNMCDRNTRPSDITTCYIDCSGRRWSYTDWTTCSETCGSSGKQYRKGYCVDGSGRGVDNSLCDNNTRESIERECNRIPCPRWVYGHWSECSRSCDGGVRMRHAQCLDAADRETHSARCGPAKTHESCNEHACTWWTFGVWSECSVTCGDGMQYREANCTDRRGSHLPDSKCNKLERHISKACQMTPCPKYKLSEWSQCSVTCDDGWSSRRVLCINGTGHEVDLSQCGSVKDRPASHQTCNQGTCPFWRLSDWGPCSVSCGVGHRERSAECIYRDQNVDASFCGDNPAPDLRQTCSLLPCTSWRADHWSPCSVTCGSGLQTRHISCIRENSKIDDYYCDKSTRPRDKKICERDACDSPRVVVAKPQVDVPPIRWATGPWTACSATCGSGIQRRLLKCRDHLRDLPDEYCSHLEKEVRQRSCQIKPCSYWKTESWQECPATCGTHVQQIRNVTCVSSSGDHVLLKDTDCDVQRRPISARSCHLDACPKGEEHLGSWVLGEWSKCSTSCGGGWRRRSVSCSETSCDETRKPRMFDRCNDQLCPPLTNNSWQISPWTHCSVSCGGGVQRRRIWCEDVLSGRKQDDSECSEMKPIEQRDCEMPPCKQSVVVSNIVTSSSSPIPAAASDAAVTPISAPTLAKWQSAQWSTCSAKCGRGTKRRTVECVDLSLNITVSSTRCDRDKKPVEELRCRVAHCPRWKATQWSSCSVTCGKGIRTREINCFRGRRQHVSDDECNPETKLNKQANCFPVACPAYKWTVTPWSKCKDDCSLEQKQTRRVFCMSNNGKRAAPRMCEPSPAPFTQRQCDTSKCPYEWVPGDWQTCSRTCGIGVQTRHVVCRLKTSNSTLLTTTTLTDPTVPKEKCEQFPKPEETQDCELNPCDSDYRWSFGLWGQCTKTCGQGIRRRKVKCVDRTGKRVEKSKCVSSNKPRRTQVCFERNCLPSTCQEIRSTTGNTRDGNYTVLLDGFTIDVYCHHMNDTIPKAYLNLNPATNYAEVYGKKLIYPHTCPYNGERNDSCQCSDDGDANAGMTRFSKVRVDLLNRKIHLSDYTFAKKIYGNYVPYATAGDCYSMKECPQGRFSMDLRSSGLRIVDDLNWEDHGHRTVSRVDRKHNNGLIEGRCGGYCGKCTPERYKGLIFEVDTKKMSNRRQKTPPSSKKDD